MGLTFPSSKEPTLGVELELQTVDPATLALVSGAPPILSRHPGEHYVKKELLKCCIELNTRICRNVADVEANLLERIPFLIEIADSLNLRLVAAGTHPFSHWHDQEVTPDARYQYQLERTQWTARRMLTFGLHVHVGVSSAEKCIAVLNALTAYVPHLLALSASSPFWEGMDSGLMSARSKVFESLPSGGLPTQVRNWAEYQRMFRILQRIGTITSIQELWGDVRPHSKYGTIEVRVCDAMSDLRELLALVALIQSLVVYLSDLYDRGTPPPIQRSWILQENKWRAVRWGLKSRLVVDESGGQVRLRHSLEDLLETLAPTAEALEGWTYLQYVSHMLEAGNSADRQRRIFQETGSLEAVVMSLEQELRATSGSVKQATPPTSTGGDIPRFRAPLKSAGPMWRDL